LTRLCGFAITISMGNVRFCGETLEPTYSMVAG
jgi:hypothetical protein